MIEISLAFAVSVFIAGLLMFLAPCTLPLVPAYLAFISGVKSEDIENKEKRKQAYALIVKNGFAFVIGFSIVFIAFGVLVGFLGSQIGQYRAVLAQVGGLFVIVFGLMMLGVINIGFLTKNYTISLPSVFTPGKPLSALFIGATFALGWTPCVGPVLASVLLLASTSATALEGGVMLAIFSLGLAIPFLLTAVLYASLSQYWSKISIISKWITYIGGVFLIMVGALLLTGNFEYTVEYGYRVFDFIGADGIFNHL